ncbi:sigma-70 family RNA polymerase sigma factor [Nocardioides euryhalodurans]|uniref:Sigma-70 family RNA polymerase sigma factor n=1 Tax=Nocardioides euryhalodurans TaxID=2518370 RepID=A0A4V1BDU7_9ACTN|nr:sigma-70 family RNA polymerase sigma factor [Nocardioides euryhalodurans]QBR92362.1 sigma-70 family RNA polymerase sigma factor [Nocardioides euryhalodurans]
MSLGSTSPQSPASHDLVTSHIALVGHVVRETMSRVPGHVSRDDLTSAGLTALVQAGRGFDPDLGVPFARYASTRIRGAVLDELRSVDWASRSVRRRARDIEETRTRLAHSLGRVPDDAQVASALGLEPAEVTANADDIARAQVLSLQGGTDESSYADSLVSTAPSPEQVLEHQERLTYLSEAVAELPERLRTVVEGYFLAERPMAEIAEELGVTESRVSQLRAEAMVLLKDALNSQLDPEQVAAPARPGGVAARRREAYFAAVAARHASGGVAAVAAEHAAGGRVRTSA